MHGYRMTDNDDVSLPGDQGMAGDVRPAVDRYPAATRLRNWFRDNDKGRVSPINDYDTLRPHA
jgi:hypothetical protein